MDEEIDKNVNSLGFYIDDMYKKCVDVPEYPTELLQTVAHRYDKDT